MATATLTGKGQITASSCSSARTNARAPSFARGWTHGYCRSSKGDKHQSNSVGAGIQPVFGGLNSTSAAPGMCSASASVLERPASLRYSSMLSSTCAGRPLSVMNTGPRWTAFLARLVS